MTLHRHQHHDPAPRVADATDRLPARTLGDSQSGSHDHSHAPDHDHQREVGGSLTRAFAVGVALNLGFVVVETGFGFWANSLSLLADASHNFGDVIGLLLAWGAATLASRRSSARFTYGFGGSTILAALANAMLLLFAIGGIAWAALQRLFFDHGNADIDEAVVIWVALAGIVVNAGTAMLFHSRQHHDLNARGAYLHMAADAAVSLGVVIAGLAIRQTGWVWLDPAVSLAIAAVILASTWGLLKESIGLALQAAPHGLEVEAVREYLSGLPGVAETHDLHIWGLSTSETALTAHLVMPGGHGGDGFLAATAKEIEARFRVGHVTLQIEAGPLDGSVDALTCKQADGRCA
jgi:cobalt-zinc-cadmium efflux system protein